MVSTSQSWVWPGLLHISYWVHMAGPAGSHPSQFIPLVMATEGWQLMGVSARPWKSTELPARLCNRKNWSEFSLRVRQGVGICLSVTSWVTALEYGILVAGNHHCIDSRVCVLSVQLLGFESLERFIPVSLSLPVLRWSEGDGGMRCCG